MPAVKVWSPPRHRWHWAVAHGPQTTITFIEGASGCGRTRLGIELAKALRENMAGPQFWLDVVRHILVSVSLLALKTQLVCPRGATRPEMVEGIKAAETVLAQVIIAALDITIKGDIDLASLVTAILDHSETGGKGEEAGMGKDTGRTTSKVLVLPFDEFQADPALVSYMLRVVRNFNEAHRLLDPTTGTRYAVLPVCAGLEVSVARTDVHTLPYFGSDEVGSEVSRLFANANVACGHQVEFASFDEVPKELRYLMEDTLGWAFAVVQLGSTYGSLKVVRTLWHARCSGKPSRTSTLTSPRPCTRARSRGSTSTCAKGCSSWPSPYPVRHPFRTSCTTTTCPPLCSTLPPVIADEFRGAGGRHDCCIVVYTRRHRPAAERLDLADPDQRPES